MHGNMTVDHVALLSLLLSLLPLPNSNRSRPEFRRMVARHLWERRDKSRGTGNLHCAETITVSMKIKKSPPLRKITQLRYDRSGMQDIEQLHPQYYAYLRATGNPEAAAKLYIADVHSSIWEELAKIAEALKVIGQNIKTN